MILNQNVDVNPIGVRTVGFFYGQSVMYDGLVRNSANWEEVEADLAEKWTISPDGLVYTFNLRKGVKWHDGVDFNADDVAFTYKTFLTKAVGSYLANDLQIIKGAPDYFAGKTDKIEGIKIIDAYTIEFDLLQPNAAMLFSVLSQHSIIPKHVWEKTTAEDLAKPGTWEKGQIGTGPFKFSQYQPDKFLEFVRNDNYWGNKPKLDKILFLRVGTTADANAVSLEKGDVDYATVPATEIDRLSKIPTLAMNTKAIYNLRYLTINTQKPYLKDKRVRQAIAYATDHVGLCQSVLLSICEPWFTISPSKAWANTSVVKYDYNTAKAQQLLKDANWDPNQEIELSLYYNDQLSKDYIAAMQQQLLKAGMKAKVVQLDPSSVQQYYYEKKQFDVMYAGFGLSPDMNEFEASFACDADWPKGSNAGLYCNKRVDELFKLGKAASDFAARKKIYDELQTILADEQPWVPLHLLKITYGFNKRVVNGDAIARNWNRPFNWHIEDVSVSDGK
ncbi:MAG: ABC transporter substrate-binding protein [Chloroflexi bacterium]|nr:ABC transporter substrate-binding protein [Chloroflexota bacterium]